MKDFLESRGTMDLYGSKDATPEGFAKGLIQNREAWIEMIQSRNRTSHSYNEETADEIAGAILPITCRSLKSFWSNSPSLRSRKHELETWP